MKRVLFLAAATALLTACGGSNNPTNNEPPETNNDKFSCRTYVPGHCIDDIRTIAAIDISTVPYSATGLIFDYGVTCILIEALDNGHFGLNLEHVLNCAAKPTANISYTAETHTFDINLYGNTDEPADCMCTFGVIFDEFNTALDEGDYTFNLTTVDEGYTAYFSATTHLDNTTHTLLTLKVVRK